MSEPQPAPSFSWPGFAAEVAQNIRFYSRLRTPRLPGEPDPHATPDFTRLPRALPLAGAAIGCVGAAGLALPAALGLPPLVCGAVAVAALVLATGAFHEDGLADMADGFGGGGTRERRLEIMRDSRVGSYGATALALSLLLRAALAGALLERLGPGPAALAMVAAASASRVAGLVPVWALPSARADGKSAAVGRPGDAAMAWAAGLAVALALVLLGPSAGPARALAACAAAALTAWPVCRLSKRLIGGQTGDVAGGAQQLAEIAFMAVLAAHLG
ncbi:adenosylcobinamide-GDP ribazoletransferase [Alsobacter sp. SYSU M60028]|uniref:Adenosylcobinamide-GDP ribazoletransferase n=1 Tax=Alsobacter ponti TaxID=2962936 RepID=A0ABT1L988_9HYPH|nr:adenosylcobinamide-GDP ribazoletransferase [Alsobacter ponti]MCP8937661.1 adenosylcobinamide-GDP ribazoletransferase [Alsobacter ponti]